MRHFALACLLALPGLAPAQQDAGLTLTSGPIDTSTLNLTLSGTSTLPPGDFQLIFEQSSQRVFIIADFSAVSAEAMRQADQREVLFPQGPGSMLLGNAPIVTIEEEGVRLPDEQFSLP